MKEQITQDLAVAAAKIVPAAGITVSTYTPGYTLSDVAVVCTIVFTLVQTFTVMVRNWGRWTSWGRARWFSIRRFWAWVKRRG
ncbi:hypothetical protein [Stenotrophomonas acidaminiphila]|uniref:hypothetical protein n=1 Tax=Stenotrophomonas acidaminiphila TaxID=128780 RepID=UPI001E11812B|nr:hypothetical protein [Stenotrophomonas acidaminiphila]MPS36033.1 hypothetical protein [Stenotrophomonas sp.]